MEKERFLKFVFNLFFSFLHLIIILGIAATTILYGSWAWSVLFLISSMGLIASYYLIFKGRNSPGLKILLIMTILNFPIGLLSGISYLLMRRWVKEEKNPLQGDEAFFGRYNSLGVGKNSKASDRIKGPMVYAALTLFISAICFISGMTSTASYILFLFLGDLLGILLFKKRRYRISAAVLILVGVISIPLGVLTLITGIKILKVINNRETEAPQPA